MIRMRFVVIFLAALMIIRGGGIVYGAGIGADEHIAAACLEAETGGLSHQCALRAVLWMEPAEAAAFFKPSPTSEELAHLAEAESLAKGVLTTRPSSVDALVLLGRLAWCSGRADDAADYYQKALTYAPNNAQALLGLVDLNLDQRRREQAENYLSRIQPTNALSGEIALRQAVLAVWRQDGEEVLRLAARGEPATAAAAVPYHWAMAKGYALTGQARKAGAIFLGKAPDWVEGLWSEQAGAWSQFTGETDGGAAAFARAVESLPYYPLPFLAGGTAFLAAGNPAGAAALLNEAPKNLGSFGGAALFLQGTAKMAAKDAIGAAKIFLDLVNRRPRLGLAYYELGRAYFTAQRYDEAYRYLGLGIRIQPDLAALYLQRAEVSDRLKMSRQAETDRQQATAARIPETANGWRLAVQSATNAQGELVSLVGLSGSRSLRGLFISSNGRDWLWYPWHGVPVAIRGVMPGRPVFVIPDADDAEAAVLAMDVPAVGTDDIRPPAFVKPCTMVQDEAGALAVWQTDEPVKAELTIWPRRGSAAAAVCRTETGFSIWHYVDLSGFQPNSYNLRISLVDPSGNTATDDTSLVLTAPRYSLSGGLTINGGAAYTTMSRVTLGLTMSGTSRNAQVRLSNEDGSFTSWRSFTTEMEWNLSPGDGLKKVMAQFRVNGGYSPIYEATITLDTKQPVISDLSVGNANDSAVMLEWRTDEPARAVIEVQYGAYWNTIYSTSNYVTSHRAQMAGLSPNSRYILRLIVVDQAGNTLQTEPFTIDTPAGPDRTPPTGSMKINGSSSYTNSIYVTLTIDAYDDSGVREVSLSNDGFTWNPMEPFMPVKQWRLTPGDGPKAVYALLRDSVGNTSAVITARITLDTVAPGIHDMTAYKRDDGRVAVAWRTNEPTYGLLQYGTSSYFPAPDDSDLYRSELRTSHQTFFTPPAGAARVYYRVTVVDQAGNTTVNAINSLDLAPADREGPVGGVSINDGAEFTRTSGVQLRIWAEDASGVSGMSLRNAGTTWGAWERYAAARSWALPRRDGVKEVQIKFKDRFGNESRIYSSRITLDTTPPVISGLVWTQTAPGTLRLAWRANEQVEVIVYYRRVQGGVESRSPADRPVSGGGYQVYLTDLSSGTYRIRMTAVDRAGNRTEVPEFEAVMSWGDHNPPTGRISINGGARLTNNAEVRLTIEASDREGPVTGMAFSQDGRNWSADVAFAGNYRYRLSGGDGRKTVYARFRDRAGNISSPVSAAIILDTRPPAISNVAVEIIDKQTAELSWRTSEPAWCEVQYGREKNDRSERAVEKGDRRLEDNYAREHRLRLERLKPGWTYYFVIVAFDQAGNSAASPEGRFQTKDDGGMVNPPDQPGGPSLNAAAAANGGRAAGIGLTRPRAGCTPTSAIDGDYRTYWYYSPAVAVRGNAYWQVEFCRAYRLTSLQLTLASTGDFTVECRQNGRWVTAYRVGSGNLASFRRGQRGDAMELEFKLNVQADAVRIIWRNVPRQGEIRLYEAAALT